MELWYADVRQLEHWSGLKQAKGFLPKERLMRLEAYRRKEDVLRGIGTGLLLEYGLRTYGITEKNVRFSYGENGKPELAEYPKLRFNLSHSGDYAAVVFSEAEAGIDIERVREGKEKLAERFFAEAEKALLRQEQSGSLFTKIWTRKESYIKATGCGMKLALDSFSTAGERVAADGVFEDYFIRSFDCVPGYWISVCSRSGMEDLRPKELSLIDIFQRRIENETE